MFNIHRHSYLSRATNTRLIATTIAIVVGVLSSTLSFNSGMTSALAQSTPTQPTSERLIPSEKPKLGVGWQITTTSGEAEIALARHLKRIGAKEYAAWWCPYCHIQKQLFGQQAHNIITSIECDPQGKNPQPKLCQAANVKQFPSWQINGQLYSGVRSLKSLAQISGYKGATNFKNFPDIIP